MGCFQGERAKAFLVEKRKGQPRGVRERGNQKGKEKVRKRGVVFDCNPRPPFRSVASSFFPLFVLYFDLVLKAICKVRNIENYYFVNGDIYQVITSFLLPFFVLKTLSTCFLFP